MSANTRHTKEFYDGYWPQNVPDLQKTREHVRAIVPDKRYRAALDGGCGTGVCSIALAELSERVVGLDISSGSLETARHLAANLGLTSVDFVQGSLLQLPFLDDEFDLVFSWGAIHHTVDPIRALDELVRVLAPGGTLVLAVYLKTPLRFVHEAVRHACLRMPKPLKGPTISLFANAVRVGERVGKRNNVRDDNRRIESQVEDWYFVPEKHFFGIEEMRAHFGERGLTYEVVCEQTGRFRSSSNFIVRGSTIGGRDART